MKKAVLFLSFALLLTAGFAGAQSITVTSPAAADTWATGSTHDIVWTIRGTMDDEVKILLFQGDTRTLEIAARVPNSGRYSWLIPATLAPGRYHVRVRTFDNAEFDNSPDFQIAIPAQPAQPEPSPGPRSPVNIVEPNGGETIHLNRTFRITWNASGGATEGRTIDLLLVHEGRPVGVVAENLPLSQRNFQWTAGRLLAGSAGADVKYKIRIRVDGTTIEDESDHSFALAALPGSCDFGVDGATFGDGTPLEHGIAVPPAAERRDVEGTFLVMVRWNGIPPASSGGRHAIRAEAVLTGSQIGAAAATPQRFSEADADPSGIIRIRFPFRLPWAEIPRMTRDRHIPVEFTIVFAEGNYDSNAVNNCRTLDMRVIGVAPQADFVAEIVPGSIRTSVRNAAGSRKWDIMNFWGQARFKNLARNEVGGPAAPVPNVYWMSEVRYMGDDGQWHQVGYDMGQITVRADEWVVVTHDRDDQSRLWEGVNAVPVNQWKPMKFVVYINLGDDVADSNKANNTAELEFTLRR